MSRARRTVAALLAVLALLLETILLSLQYGLVEEYGPGGGSIAFFAILPIGAAVGAVSVAGGSRARVIALGVFVVVTVAGLPVSAALGQRDRLERFVAVDSTFTCNGPNAEVSVPVEVDRAFHVPVHPAEFTLYGPISGSPLGCTAAIHADDPDESFGAWRTALLDSGWTVQRDDDEVVVVDGGVRLTLYVEDGLAYLNTSTDGADDCADGRFTSYDDGSISAC